MMSIGYAGIAIVPLLIGVLEVLKKTGLNKRFIPIVSLILGTIIGVVLYGSVDMIEGVLIGVAIGLSSVGLYSGVKNSIE